MMKSYTAYCMNEDGENMCMTREYNSKKDFINDLHGNGYKVHFVALTDKYDEESEKYNARRIQKNREAKIRRETERAWAKRSAEIRAEIEARYAAEEETAEEPAADQEPETIKPFDELTEEEINAIIAEEVEKEYFGEPAADQAEETSENYIAWCGMIENDVITDEFETLSEVVDEVETKYTKEEQKALGVTYCRLLCNAGQWLECLEEKTVDDVYYF